MPEQIVIATDQAWLADGKAAVELGSDPWGASIYPQMAEHLPRPVDPSSPKPPGVRASLVQSSLLMRALGRPNREQVVTSRPEDLTTLQALELNNGAEFVGYLERGASKWFGEKSGEPDAMIDAFYLTALSRLPHEMERAVARGMSSVSGDPRRGCRSTLDGADAAGISVCKLISFDR